MQDAPSVKPTLLDSSLERLAAAGRGLLPSTRMTLVGQLEGGASVTMFGSWCQSKLQTACPSATGLLLALPTGFVHTFEGPQTEVCAYLKLLATNDELAKCIVIASQEDVRTRYFPHHVFKEGNAQRSNYAELDEDGVPALLGETAIAMLKIGKKFTADGTTAISAAALLDSWESHFADCMPSNERIGQVLDLEGLPTLADFLRIYEQPVDTKMEGESMWPPERAVVY